MNNQHLSTTWILSLPKKWSIQRLNLAEHNEYKLWIKFIKKTTESISATEGDENMMQEADKLGTWHSG
jgi:hypothetical protein